MPKTAGVLALDQRVGFDGSLALFIVHFHSVHFGEVSQAIILLQIDIHFLSMVWEFRF